jgi:hypothetical protein
LSANWRFWKQLERLVFPHRLENHPARLVLLSTRGLHDERHIIRVVKATSARINLRDDLPVAPPIRGNLK